MVDAKIKTRVRYFRKDEVHTFGEFLGGREDESFIAFNAGGKDYILKADEIYDARVHPSRDLTGGMQNFTEAYEVTGQAGQRIRAKRIEVGAGLSMLLTDAVLEA